MDQIKELVKTRPELAALVIQTVVFLTAGGVMVNIFVQAISTLNEEARDRVEACHMIQREGLVAMTEAKEEMKLDRASREHVGAIVAASATVNTELNRQVTILTEELRRLRVATETLQ